MRIVFMGTPEFAVASLRELVEAGRQEIVAVVTQPDRPQGRGNKVLHTPVKEYALSKDIPVLQPRRVRLPEALAEIRAYAPDLIVVAAYGQILPKELLEMPRFGCINVHASLLPHYRGASPIHHAILNGDRETGVTIMQLDEGMDTGAMLDKVVVPIGDETTMGELREELQVAGGRLLLKVIDDITAGTVRPVRQNDGEATYASLLQRQSEEIDWKKSAREIHNKIRAFNPEPGAFTRLPSGKLLKIWGSRLSEEEGGGEAGKVLAVGKKGFVVACGEGSLLVTEVQPESKKKIAAGVFCNGRGVAVGDILVSEE